MATATGSIPVALASEFWGLGCPEIYNEVATRLLDLHLLISRCNKQVTILLQISLV